MKNIFKRNQIMITALAIMIAVAGYLNFAGNKIGGEDLVMATGSEAVNETGDGMLSEAEGGSTAEIAEAGVLDISAEDNEQAALTDIESLDSEVVLESTDFLDDTITAEAAKVDTETAKADAETVKVDAEAAKAGTETAKASTANAGAAEIKGNAELGTPGEAVFTTSNVGNLASAKLVKEQTRAKSKETLLEVINNKNIDSSQKQDAINNMIALTDIAEKEMSAEILLEAKGFSDAVVSISNESVDVVVNAGELTDAQRAQIEDIVKRKTGITAENIIITPI